jgi:hypothetical protein
LLCCAAVMGISLAGWSTRLLPANLYFGRAREPIARTNSSTSGTAACKRSQGTWFIRSRKRCSPGRGCSKSSVSSPQRVRLPRRRQLRPGTRVGKTHFRRDPLCPLLPILRSCFYFLCGVFGQFGYLLAMILGRSDDLHLLPVVGEFPATVKTDDVGPGQSSGLGAALCATDGYGEAIASMFATKQHVY